MIKVAHYDLMEGILGRSLFPKEKGIESGLAWSIRNSLKVLLNTKRGTLLHLPDYGLPEISSVQENLPDSLELLRSNIAASVQKYEPRLTNIKVTLTRKDDKVFRATYMVTAKVVSKYEEIPVIFKTEIKSDGKIEIL